MGRQQGFSVILCVLFSSNYLTSGQELQAGWCLLYIASYKSINAIVVVFSFLEN